MSKKKKKKPKKKIKIEKCIFGRAAWVGPLPVGPGIPEEVREGAAAAT